MIFPDEPSVRSYEKDLKDIPFPLTFKICIQAGMEYTKFLNTEKNFGYANIKRFYKGMWINDTSIRGWTGFKADGSPLNDVKGLFLRNKDKIIFQCLGIIGNVTKKFKEVLTNIKLESTKGVKLINETIPEQLGLQYVHCTDLDLSDFFNLEKHIPSQLLFTFNIVGVGVTIYVDDINRKASRTLRSSRLVYNGSPLQNLNLTKQLKFQYYFKLSQVINIDSNVKMPCRNYPNGEFQTFEECDQNFVFRQVKRKYNSTPFWATKNYEEVTAMLKADYNAMDMLKYPMGEIESSCYTPCVSTKVLDIKILET